MAKQTSTYDQRVRELREQGKRPIDANRIALAEERARAEHVADQTYRRES